jgi:hypothetical protein
LPDQVEVPAVEPVKIGAFVDDEQLRRKFPGSREFPLEHDGLCRADDPQQRIPVLPKLGEQRLARLAGPIVGSAIDARLGRKSRRQLRVAGQQVDLEVFAERFAQRRPHLFDQAPRPALDQQDPVRLRDVAREEIAHNQMVATAAITGPVKLSQPPPLDGGVAPGNPEDTES